MNSQSANISSDLGNDSAIDHDDGDSCSSSLCPSKGCNDAPKQIGLTGQKRTNKTATANTSTQKKSKLTNIALNLLDESLDNDKKSNKDDVPTTADMNVERQNEPKSSENKYDMMTLCMARNISEEETSQQQKISSTEKSTANNKMNTSTKSHEQNQEQQNDQIKSSGRIQKSTQEHSTKNIQPSFPSSLQQPEGWRVKLYRLNSDGSWDDCGTGRIVCFINDTMKWGNLMENGSKLSHEGNTKASDALKDLTELEDELYKELGEPTLCMHAEIPNNTLQDSKASSSKNQKVLLRTRVLLQDAYQRQGDNIITWCEPFFPSESLDKASKKSDDCEYLGNDQQLTTGVDLALSFQDNAGCLDIWSKISSVQNRAGELFRVKRRPLAEMTSVEKKIPNESQDTESLDEQYRGHNETGISNPANSQQQQQCGTNNIGCNEGKLQRIHNADSHLQGTTPSIDGSGCTSDTGQGLISEQRTNTQQNPKQQQQQQQQHAMWTVVSSEQNQHHLQQSGTPASVGGISFDNGGDQEFQESDTEGAAVSMAAAAAAAAYVGGGPMTGINMGSSAMSQGIVQTTNIDQIGQAIEGPQLPNPPSLSDLEEIVDVISSAQMQQRESIALYIAQTDCAYLKAILQLFPSAESKEDFQLLAALAVCVKSILLLNEPSIIELIATDGEVFENVCCALEYDPDLRIKANHRWFIRERARFRTVVLMEDEELISTIHRSFRVTYLRDTLLRPTMDEHSLSTLASLLTFTHADVVKGVMSAPPTTVMEQRSLQERNDTSFDDSYLESHTNDSYLYQVLRMLGREIKTIRKIESENSAIILSENENLQNEGTLTTHSERNSQSVVWKQHLAPQDSSLSSRKIRRQGCLHFLRELFNMVRLSLQQNDKDDFYAMIVLMPVDISEPAVEDGENENQTNDTSMETENENVNLLLLLGAILCDPNTDTTERGSCLEVLSAISMHNPSLIRRHCLEVFASSRDNGDHTSNLGSNKMNAPPRPEPNDRDQVILRCPQNDLLLSLLFLMAYETDAGILLQTSEIIRMILDTEMLGDNCVIDGLIGQDEQHSGYVENRNNFCGIHPNFASQDQNSFLTMFYDFYFQWLVAPFHYSILIPHTPLLFSGIRSGKTVNTYKEHQLRNSKKEFDSRDTFFTVPFCATRTSLAIELLSFCVRAHCHRMRIFILKSRIIGKVLKHLNPKSTLDITSGNRCLKLASLRLLRSILSLKDDFYHRHIVQFNLFAPVFEAFCANPVGDNLVSSTIIEMCDFIKTENIKPLIEYIVTKYLQQTLGTKMGCSSLESKRFRSIEDVATPYVNTLAQLREKHEENMRSLRGGQNHIGAHNQNGASHLSSSMCIARVGMNQKAIEDQRKFRERDEEESYFNEDDDEVSQSQHVNCSLVGNSLGTNESELEESRQFIGICASVSPNQGTKSNADIHPPDIHSISKFSFSELDNINRLGQHCESTNEAIRNENKDLTSGNFDHGSTVVASNIVFDQVKTQY